MEIVHYLLSGSKYSRRNNALFIMKVFRRNNLLLPAVNEISRGNNLLSSAFNESSRQINLFTIIHS